VTVEAVVRRPSSVIDPANPSVARVYNYYLGGKDNYVADRDLAEEALRTAPIMYGLVQANRVYLRQAARYLAEQAGIRRFVDIGCGLPAHVNLDDVVRRVDPGCRVAYVDNDPMVLTHAQALLAVDPGIGAFHADLREPGTVLGDPGLRDLIGLDEPDPEPVAVFLLDVLPFITDAEDPRAIVDDLLRRLPPGSHLVISHIARNRDLDAVSSLYEEAGVPFTPRNPGDVAALVRDLEPIVPGPDLGPVHGWDGSAAIPFIGCMGRKRA
jgi:SAM-dependent methyltransferase